MYGVTAVAYKRALAKKRISRQEGQDEPEGMEPTEVAGAGNKLRIVLIVTAIVYSSHPTPTGLTISLNSGKVTLFNSSDIYLNIVLTIKNDSPHTITYWGSAYTLTDNGASVDNGLWKDNVVLSPGHSQVLNETADISLGDNAGLTGPSASVGMWEIQGVATVLVNGGNSTQTYQFNFATQ
jgi:hypothetical protein